MTIHKKKKEKKGKRKLSEKRLFFVIFESRFEKRKKKCKKINICLFSNTISLTLPKWTNTEPEPGEKLKNRFGSVNVYIEILPLRGKGAAF